MSYIKFILTLISIPMGIIALLSLHLFFWFFRVQNEEKKINWISTIRCLYFRIVCKVLSIKSSHFNSQILSKNPDLVILNHHSFLDIFVIGCTFRGYFLAKAEVQNWPAIGILATLGGVVFVSRESIQSRIKTLLYLRKISGHSGICLFPEGTTTSNIFPIQQNWNHGGFATLIKNRRIIVQTHAISYLEHEFHAWEGDKDFISHLLGICKKQTVIVHLRSNELERESLKIGESRSFSLKTYQLVKKLAIANHRDLNELRKTYHLSELSYRTT